MTKPDPATARTAPRPLLGQVLFYVGFCLALGVIGAGLAVFLNTGLDMVQLAILAGIGLAGCALVWLAIRIGDFDPPGLSSNTGKSQAILLASCVLGGIIGVYLTASGTIDRFMDGDFTISRIEALVGLFILFGMAVPASILRERTADDYERAASREAAYWALWAYFTLYIGWTIAALGSLVPPVNDFALFGIVIFLMLGMWMVKRSG